MCQKKIDFARRCCGCICAVFNQKIEMGRSSGLGRLRKSVSHVYRGSEMVKSCWSNDEEGCLNLNPKWDTALGAVCVNPLVPVYDMGTSQATRLFVLTRVLTAVTEEKEPLAVFVSIDDYRWPAKPYCHQVAVYWSGSKMYFYDPMGPLKSTFYGPHILASNLSKAVGVRIEFAGGGTGVQRIANCHGCVPFSAWAMDVLAKADDVDEAFKRLHDRAWLKKQMVSIDEFTRRLSSAFAT